MNLFRSSFATVAAAGLLFSAAAPAAFAAPKDYQYTGTVKEVTDTMISVQKGKDATAIWEFAKTADTKAAADVKVGDKVTVHYMMNATTIDPSAAATKTAPAGKTGTKAEKKAVKTGAKTEAAAPAESPSKPAAEGTPTPQ